MTNKEHNTLRELALYALQCLPVGESTAVSTHLQICPACRTDEIPGPHGNQEQAQRQLEAYDRHAYAK